MRLRSYLLLGLLLVLAGAGLWASWRRADAGPPAQEAFAQAFAGEIEAEQFASAGLMVTSGGDAENAINLAPDGDACAGQGHYRIDPAATVPVAITAPHADTDRLTGDLTAALFGELRAAGFATNSVPRHPTDACPQNRDLAQASDHPFTGFALGFARKNPEGLVVQLHGFGHIQRDSQRAAGAAMIVSDGTSEPSERLLDLADCLSIAFAPREVLVFPIDTAELGGTRNAQGKAMRELGLGTFAHIEMSLGMREQLVKDAGERTKLAACLSEVAR